MPEENKTPKTEVNTEPEKKEPTKLSDLAEKTEPEKKDNDDKEIDIHDSTPPEEKKVSVEKPEGLPDELWDKENNTLIVNKTVDELAKQIKINADWRRKISKGLKADLPEKAEDYALAFSKDLADFKIGEDEQSKTVIEGLKQVAFKNGIGQTQLNGFINDYLKMEIEKGILKKPLTEAEQELENQKFIKEQKAILGDNAEKVITASVQWIEQKHKGGIFSEEQKNILVDFIDKDAKNVLIMDVLRKMTGEPEIPTVNAKVDGLPSDAEIARNMQEGKYTPEQEADVMKKRYAAGRTEPISMEHFNITKPIEK